MGKKIHVFKIFKMLKNFAIFSYVNFAKFGLIFGFAYILQVWLMAILLRNLDTI